MNPFNTSLTNAGSDSTAPGTLPQVGLGGSTPAMVPTFAPSVQSTPGQFQMFPPVSSTIGTSGSPAVFTPEPLNTSVPSMSPPLVPGVPLAPIQATSTAALFPQGGNTQVGLGSPLVSGGSPLVAGGSPLPTGGSPLAVGGSPLVQAGKPLTGDAGSAVPGGSNSALGASLQQSTVTATPAPLLTDITAGATPASLLVNTGGSQGTPQPVPWLT